MSTFNTRKDRDRRGKAGAHKHTDCACITGKFYHPDVNNKYNFQINYCTAGTHEWKRTYSTIPRRSHDRLNIHLVMRGVDPDGISWYPDRYPDNWYW